MGGERLEHEVCGQAALEDVAEDVTLKRSKAFSYSLVKRQSSLPVPTSQLAYPSYVMVRVTPA